MPAGLTERDRQVGKTQAWHRMTQIEETITRENSMPWDVVVTPVLYCVPTGGEDAFGDPKTEVVESPDYKILIATDDHKPVGMPFGNTYNPSDIATFWNIIKKGMGETPYEVISAGSVDDRCKLFASLKTTDGFRIGDREFKDYITLLDSFDKSCALTVVYSNICTVCSNTFAANLQSGKVVGKAKHTLLLESNIQRLIDAIDHFAGTSAYFKDLMTRADEVSCSRDEAHAWITGLECRNTDKLTNGTRQRTARMAELFDKGRGNNGRTRLDALCAVTDFYSHESSRSSDNQYYSSEFGTGATTKRFVVENFEKTWDKFRKEGEAMLAN